MRTTAVYPETHATRDHILRSIGGLICWLRSDLAVTLSSSKVASWGDMSAHSNDASQTTDARRPTLTSGGANGFPYLSCGQGGQFSQLTFPVNAFSALVSGTVYAVLQQDADPTTTGSGGLWQFSPTDTNESFVPFTDGTIYDSFGRASNAASANPSVSFATSPVIYSAVSAPSYWSNFVNGSPLYSTATNAVSFASACMLFTGPQGGLGTYYFKGKFYELALFRKRHTANEMALVTNYLKTRYSIT